MLSLLQKSKDVLGMNARNLKYIRPYNLQSAKRLADDKLRSKRVLKKGGIPVPKLIGTIRTIEDLDGFDFSSLPNSFVLKPNFGFGGEGIVVVYGRKKGQENVWVKANKGVVTEEDLKTHIRNILDGSFSRTGTPDVAFFEERIMLLKLFKPYSYKGIPDIRVIVFNKVPVMAMLRLPTESSGGTSNVHGGGIAVGVDMSTGVTTSAIQRGRSIDYVPGKRLLLSGIKIPLWEDILHLAVKAQEISGLGYLGADIAIDRERGPVFMEINARPGLVIQNANHDGLLGRLKRVEGLKVKTSNRAVTLAKNLFGGEIEEEIEEISGKRIIKTFEKVKFIDKDKKEFEVEAKIDTGAFSTSIDVDIAKRIGFEKTWNDFIETDYSDVDVVRGQGRELEKEFMRKHGKDIYKLENVSSVFSSSGSTFRPVVKMSFIMDKEKVISRANIVNRKDLKHAMIIGRKDLKKFLVEV